MSRQTRCNDRRWEEVPPFSIGALFCAAAFAIVANTFGAWPFLLLLGVAFPLIFVGLADRRMPVAPWLPVVAVAAVVAACTWSSADWPVHMLLVCLLALVVCLCRSLTERVTRVDATVIFLVSLIGAAPIFQIPNGVAFLESFHENPIVLGFGLIISVVLSYFTVLKVAEGKLNGRFAWLLGFLIGSLCLAMAFRTDALFVGSAQGHWSYFVGPVQGVRAGGWLLWNVPSQYGFLPILLAAKLPFVSAWTSFYVFQGVVLFVSSLAMFKILVDLKVPVWAAGVAVVALFFLADPRGSIGPSPYPSSSAVRFVWCYVSLWVAVRTFVVDNADARTFVLRNTLPWLCSLLWSAESAVYVSVISVSTLLMVFRDTSLPVAGRLQQALLLIRIPLGALVLAMAIMVAIYGIGLGTVPDLAMFVQYAVGYAGGFGSVPLALAGPIWVFFITLSLGLSGALGCYQARSNVFGAILAACGCILAIFSYYLGRAVPDNVTALLPLIVVSLLIIIRADSSASASVVRTSYGQAFISVAVVSTLFAPKSLEVLMGALRAPMSPAEKIEVADASLLKGIKEMEIGIGAPVSYFGYEAIMPSLGAPSYATFDVPFAPTPPQSLEVPISEAVRDKILRRRFCPGVPFGFYIEKLSDTQIRAAEWRRAIEQWYAPAKTYDDGSYRIIRFEKKPNVCP